MLTRKHFNKIAKSLSNMPESQYKADLVRELCVMFVSLNPRFDSIRFVVACYNKHSPEHLLNTEQHL